VLQCDIVSQSASETLINNIKEVIRFDFSILQNHQPRARSQFPFSLNLRHRTVLFQSLYFHGFGLYHNLEPICYVQTLPSHSLPFAAIRYQVPCATMRYHALPCATGTRVPCATMRHQVEFGLLLASSRSVYLVIDKASTEIRIVWVI